MPYEIEFHPVGDGERSGDAITLRYWDGSTWRVMVIDGGYQATGEEVRDHIRRFYGTNHVDYVVSTHPDNDHISGLRIILSEMTVGQLWLHIPHLHAGRIIHLFRSDRWRVENLENALRRAYPAVEELISLATAQGTQIEGPFQGARIGPFTVLSPTLAMYDGLLPQFRDTPQYDGGILAALGHLITGVGRRFSQAIRYAVQENWWTETLREGGTTAAENESSVVLYGNLGAGPILLTADAGLVGLTAAANYADAAGLPLGHSLSLFQVPHHGSRNNVSPSVLNRLVGPVLLPGQYHPAGCIISAGINDPTHPRQVVVNALVRRGLNPTVTRGNTTRFVHGMQDRQGWTSAPTLGMVSTVEEYD